MVSQKIKDKRKKIASERIRELFGMAFKNDRKRYIELARELSTKYNCPIPRDLKRFFCKECNAVLKPSNNCRIRYRKDNIVYTCKECGNIMRYRYRS